MAKVNATKQENGHEKETKETYEGLTASLFKFKWGNHRQSFEKPQFKNSTEFSKYIWKTKDQNIKDSIKLKIIGDNPYYINTTPKMQTLHNGEVFHTVQAKESFPQPTGKSDKRLNFRDGEI